MQLGVLPPPCSLSGVPLASSAPQVTFSVPSPIVSTSVNSMECLASAPFVPGLPGPVPPSMLATGSIGPPTRVGLSLSLSTEPIPARLVQRIQSGQFVDMRDLLGDNIALTQHFEAAHSSLPNTILPLSSRPRLREVSSLPSWIYCFLTYLAVGTADQTTRNRLVYAGLIVREALLHGGRDWLDYDRLFRQQAAVNPSLSWSCLHPSLLASTILGQRPGLGTFCTICQGFDHLPPQCAMTYLRQPTRQDSGLALRSHRPGQSVCWSWNEGHCYFHPAPCSRLHVCATCGSSQHKARDCKDTPPESRFKQPRKSRPVGLPPPNPTH